MASNVKWREWLESALAEGDLTFWNNNKGFLSVNDQVILEEKYLAKSTDQPAASVPAPKPKKAEAPVVRPVPKKAVSKKTSKRK